MKRIIIIGATSGIGLEVARCYLKAGWQVGVAGRREEELEKLRQSAPGQVCTQRIDVTREDAPALLEQLIMKTGGMDVFLLSSGIGKQIFHSAPISNYRPQPPMFRDSYGWSMPPITISNSKAKDI